MLLLRCAYLQHYGSEIFLRQAVIAKEICCCTIASGQASRLSQNKHHYHDSSSRLHVRQLCNCQKTSLPHSQAAKQYRVARSQLACHKVHASSNMPGVNPSHDHDSVSSEQRQHLIQVDAVLDDLGQRLAAVQHLLMKPSPGAFPGSSGVDGQGIQNHG